MPGINVHQPVSRTTILFFFWAKTLALRTRRGHKKCKSDLLRSLEAKRRNDSHFLRNPFSLSDRGEADVLVGSSEVESGKNEDILFLPSE